MMRPPSLIDATIAAELGQADNLAEYVGSASKVRASRQTIAQLAGKHHLPQGNATWSEVNKYLLAPDFDSQLRPF